MKNYENPTGTKRTNNLTALYFCEIATAIPKKICLASYLFSSFFERNQLIEPTYNNCFNKIFTKFGEV